MASTWRPCTPAWTCSVTSDPGPRPKANVTGTGAPWPAAAVSRAKPLLFLLCLYPAFRWVFLAFSPDGLGANPPEFLIRSTGIWSLVLLWATLGITPLRRLLRQPALVRLRRMLGLFSFFYALLHVLGWAYWERGWLLAEMWADIVQRTFIWVGVLAFLPMVLLALTSTRGWMRRLGAGWQRLHASIYAIALLSVWHFWLVRSGKVDYREPVIYAAVLAGLFLVRVLWRRAQR